MAAARKQNVKQPLTRPGITVSTLWGFERTGSSESERVARDRTAINLQL